MERGFIGLDVAVLAVSNAATNTDDVPARLVVEKLESAGHRVVARERIVDSPDDSPELITAKYREWIANPEVDVVLVISSATSESASDALVPLVTRPVTGFAELFRSITFAEIGTAAMLVDAAAGQCTSTFIFVLPASVGAVRTALDKLLLPQLDYRTKPMNLVMRMPRHHRGATTDTEAPAKTPWIVPKDPKTAAQDASAPAVAPPRTTKPRAGTEPGTPAALASVSQRIAVAALARPEPVSVSQRMSAVLEAAAAPISVIENDTTDVGIPPPPSPPTRAKVITAKANVPLKPPAQVIPLAQLLANKPAPADEPVEELPAAELKEIAPAQIVDDEPLLTPSPTPTQTSTPTPVTPVSPVSSEELPIPAALSTKIPTGPIRIEDESTRQAILTAQKRAVTERVTPIDELIDDELPPRSVAIPARRKRDRKLIAIGSVIVLASLVVVVAMFLLARDRDRRARALLEQQREADTLVADLAPPEPPPLRPEPHTTARPDPGAVPDERPEPAEPAAPADPDHEIDMSADPSVLPSRTSDTPVRATTTLRARPAQQLVDKPAVDKVIDKAVDRSVDKSVDKSVEKPVPASAVEAGCDEVSCVLDRYRLSCCAKYKPAEPSAPPVHAGLPEKLDKPMVTAGIAKVKPAVIACGEKTGAKGDVRIRVTVSPAGTVTDASAADAPDATLGECVAGAVRRATFAKTETGGSFTYPFVF